MASTFSGVRELHSGLLTKMGGKVKSWKRRWMILQSNHTLQYYKEPGKVPLGTINLRDAGFNIMAGSRNSCSWPKNCNVECAIVLNTSERVYYMYADDVREAEEWVRQLQKYADEATKVKGSNASLPSRYNKMGGKALDLQTPTAVPTSDGHTPKMYKKKEKRLLTKRFNTVSGKDNDDDEEEPSEDNYMGMDDGVMDGEMDMKKFETYSPEMSITLPKEGGEEDGMYDIAQLVKEKPRVTSPNSNNNNGRDTSAINVHESLYDLVGRINAGEEPKSDTVIPENQQFYEVLPGEQDMYEPMSDPPTPSHPSSLPPCSTSLPNNSRSMMHGKTLSLGFLPPIPHQPSLDLYEPIAADNLALYEEIELKRDNVVDSDSSDDEVAASNHMTTPTLVAPPIPRPRRLTKDGEEPPPIPPFKDPADSHFPLPIGNHGDDGYYGNAPTLPLKTPSRSPSPLPIGSHGDDGYYGNAPILPQKTPPRSPSPAPLPVGNHDDDGYYDNAPFLPKKASDSVLPLPDKIPQVKSPVPKPRKLSKPIVPIVEDQEGVAEDIYDDTVSVVTRSSRMLSIESSTESSHDIDEVIDEVQDPVQSKGQVTDVVTTTAGNAPPTGGDTVTYRTSPKKLSTRSHSATVGVYDQGIAMFHRRAMDVSVDRSSTSCVKQLILTNDIETLGNVEKSSLAETLREIETERQLASEERFKWERERLKLEEERKRFEEEKRKFQEEMKKMQNLEK